MWRALLRLVGRSVRAATEQTDLTESTAMKTKANVGAIETTTLDGDRDSKPRRSGRLVAKPKAKALVRVNVGIDFGTSSTKVFFRDLHHMKTYACGFTGNPSGYSPTCLPSAVRIVDDKVYFASAAENISGGVLLRSFKMCMCCQFTDVPCSKCPNALFSANHALGRLEHATHEAFSAEEVAAWYLGYVIGEVRRRIDETLPDFQPSLTYQMAAPLGMIESRSTRDSFERALHLGEALSNDVTQGIELATLRSLFQGYSMSLRELPPIADRKTFVQPETHAAMIGYAASPLSDDGLYAIVDIGAGTTDVSFFRLSREVKKLAYYSTDTVRLGADQVDWGILQAIVARHGTSNFGEQSEALEDIRVGKQIVDDAISLTNGLTFTKRDRDNAASQLGAALFSEYKRVWGHAYQKEMLESRWQNGYKLIVIGGGSRLLAAVEPLRQSPSPQIMRHPGALQLELPAGITMQPSTAHDNAYDHAELLMVAYGLSFHFAESPEYFTPKEVEPIERAQPTQRPSWDIGPFD